MIRSGFRRRAFSAGSMHFRRYHQGATFRPPRVILILVGFGYGLRRERALFQRQRDGEGAPEAFLALDRQRAPVQFG